MNRQTNIYDTLRYLVEWTAPPRTLVISLYLDLSEDAEDEPADFARAAWNELWPRHEDNPGAGELALLVERELELLPDRVERARRRGHLGLALFACHDPALNQRVSLRFPLESQVLIGRDPFLRHLLGHAEE